MRELSRYHRLVSAARRRLAGAMTIMVLLISVVGVAPVGAVETLTLDQDRVVYGEEGSTFELAEAAIVADRIGSLCTMRVHAENQFSVHPGNDLLITTGGTQTVIEDIEAEPDADRDLSAGVVLGPVLVVELRFGPHQVSSMGFDLSVDCATTAPVIVEQNPDPCPAPGDSDPATSTTVPSAECPDPTPVSEVQVPTPTLPQPCNLGHDGGDGSDGTAGSGVDGSLTVGPDSCDEPTTTVAPTTTPPTTVPAATSPPTTAAAVQSTTAAPATTGPTPTVKGLQITRQLPQTPAAAPVQGAPAYTG